MDSLKYIKNIKSVNLKTLKKSSFLFSQTRKEDTFRNSIPSKLLSESYLECKPLRLNLLLSLFDFSASPFPLPSRGGDSEEAGIEPGTTFCSRGFTSP